MKIVKSIIILFVISSFNLSQGQEIVKKWEDLNYFSSILTKANYIVKEEGFNNLSEYSTAMAGFIKKLSPDNMPKELRTEKTDEELTKLGSYIREFDTLVKQKADKIELKTSLNKLNETYTNFVKMVKVK